MDECGDASATWIAGCGKDLRDRWAEGETPADGVFTAAAADNQNFQSIISYS